MLTSKRQEWILQMIKGPDISLVENCPGHYTSKSTINITADSQCVIIKPGDVLDLSNPEYLVVRTDDGECTVVWDRISNLDFEEQGVTITNQRPRLRTAANRMLHFPLGKKVG
jgi:hypothetical protein